jgi:hypothetical protein
MRRMEMMASSSCPEYKDGTRYAGPALWPSGTRYAVPTSRPAYVTVFAYLGTLADFSPAE